MKITASLGMFLLLMPFWVIATAYCFELYMRYFA